jgi:hypothetical protein
MTDPRENFDDLPPALRDQLRALYAPPSSMPQSRDDAILSAVRAVSGGHRWRFGRFLRVGAGLAAAVALAATLWWLSPKGEPAVAAYVRTGDIRDAFYLARQLKKTGDTRVGGTNTIVVGSWDINHDGRVDGADVQSLALAAVKLEKGAVR